MIEQGSWKHHTGPAKMASNATTEPMATPAITPVSLLPEDTCRITNISINVRMNSRIKDCHQLPLGKVALVIEIGGIKGV